MHVAMLIMIPSDWHQNSAAPEIADDATGARKRGDNQLHRFRVLEVRIHSSSVKSPMRISSNPLRNQISADDPSAGSSVYAKAKVVDGARWAP
jgi:hypothetical protein